ncbi:hypothetical protein HB662_19805 [Roseomonas frigidaquae]|uniref:Uncharacterized protein n=1 Tax=Falsiroseomonas frigidaquae TaxID=487318 RepID=A0ABX1F405_9PROT|nr:hypothetical protein [Falsiroseomonas frigidaquae]NKE47035.1 hypothetical protein [Falsiroseomonas frigidaquae]
MNQIAPIRPGASTEPLPEAPPRIAPMSQAAEEAVSLAVSAREARPDNDAPRLAAGQVAVVQEEISKRLAALERALSGGCDDPTINSWLMICAGMIGHPRDPDEMRIRFTALRAALRELPRRCFTLRSAKAVAAAHKWFPGLHEMLAILTPETDDLRRERARLHAAMNTFRAGPAEPPATPAEREAMAAAARARVAELLASSREDRARPGGDRPLHYSPEALLAHYQRTASGGGPFAKIAAFRVQHLRRQLGKDE